MPTLVGMVHGQPCTAREIDDVRQPHPIQRACSVDALLVDIVDYVRDARIDSPLAFQTAHCLLDTLGCGLEALASGLQQAARSTCAGHQRGQRRARAGTHHVLDPVQAFNLGAMVRWLDFNDTWLAAEWGHPSDNLGGILAVCDWLGRNAQALRRPPPTVHDVLLAMIKAHEIQACWRCRIPSTASGWTMWCWSRWPPPRWSRSCSGWIANACSMRCRWPGSMARRCAPTGTRPTPARARAGPLAMRPVVACVWR